jgi:hypothetical protein
MSHDCATTKQSCPPTFKPAWQEVFLLRRKLPATVKKQGMSSAGSHRGSTGSNGPHALLSRVVRSLRVLSRVLPSAHCSHATRYRNNSLDLASGVISIGTTFLALRSHATALSVASSALRRVQWLLASSVEVLSPRIAVMQHGIMQQLILT